MYSTVQYSSVLPPEIPAGGTLRLQCTVYSTVECHPPNQAQSMILIITSYPPYHDDDEDVNKRLPQILTGQGTGDR